MIQILYYYTPFEAQTVKMKTVMWCSTKLLIVASVWNLLQKYAVLGFSKEECLKAHNSLRNRHVDTPNVQYSSELDKETQKYADSLAQTDSGHGVLPTRKLPKRRAIPGTPTFFHKEMWDGEVVFPHSRWNLNQNRQIHVGESIHKFCCYSYPYCPKEFFYQLNFPPSAESVVQHWYNTEITNYDFKRGRKKHPDDDISHFTNIVWSNTKELGCGQSKMSSKGCVYTVVRYRSQGSIGLPSNFINNVKDLKSSVPKQESPPENSALTAFFVALVVVVVLLLCALIYFKRRSIRDKYNEFIIMRNVRRSERGPGKEDWMTRFFPCFGERRSVVYNPSEKDRRPRPTIEIITPVHATQEDETVKGGDDTVVYENLPKKFIKRNPFSKKVRYDRQRKRSSEEPTACATSSPARTALIQNEPDPSDSLDEEAPRPASVSGYVNIEIGTSDPQGTRAQTMQGLDKPSNPALPLKPKLSPQRLGEMKPMPARRPMSETVTSTPQGRHPQQRNLGSADNKKRPFPTPRNKPRAETDINLAYPTDLKTDLDKMKKLSSNDPSATRSKPQVPRRPESHNLNRRGYDNECSSPNELPENRYSDSSGAGRISEMKKLLGSQGVR